MRAVVMRERGGEDVLVSTRVGLPVPGPLEVRVRVRATALNHLDLWVRRGVASPRLPLPHILGSDVAGEIDALGPGCEDLEVGARVMLNPGVSCGHCEACLSGRDNLCRRYRILGEHRSGGYADYIVVPRQNLVPIPPGLSFLEAATVPLASLTAWQMVFDRADVRPWHTVLVMAAGSGVSGWAIQLCKLAGARVIATAGSDEKLQQARELGADEVINYRSEDYGARVKALTAGQGVDIAIDHTGADNWASSLRALRWGGTLVTCGATSGYEALTPLNVVFYKQLSVLGSTMGSKADLFKIARLLEQGRLRPLPFEVLPLEAAAEAHARLASRAFFGKLVLEV
ncbi:NADPH:quinone reductase-like Zn-dependent oxidoreductase [Deinobacterium chartae]|uniref:NADPH:quinone reductase-like Zn-dependent oxidoreductase n=1 Tax=Deinobacterium chartae TaxID=521158 RepID=A0A841I2M7_9DEIO|nr:zinc-binding dehydrogenase [Deinobacterium chartae]MBB6098175.1 NADPH:quinone reductase-like Zn-dependent oxidoreductase [Deinobacterium chartae]